MKKYDSISIWDLGDYNGDLNIILSKTGRGYVRKKILERCGSLKNASREIGVGYWGLVGNLRGRSSMDFSRLIRLVEKLNLNKQIIQREAEGLVTRSIRIQNIHFPVQCSPVFTSLFTNLLGDGGARGGNGSGYFHYAESEAHQLIQEKINNVLGITAYQNGESLPRLLVFLMLKYFGVDSVSTKDSILPPKILQADKLSKVASLTAFINDEGTVTTSFIQIYSSNYKLLEGIRALSRSLNYKVSQITCRKDKEVYLFRINLVKEFHRDYKELIKRYPETRLISRKERILRILDLIARGPKIIRNTKEIFDLISPILKSGPKTIYDLCEVTKFTQSALWRHLRKLISGNLIKRERSNFKTRFIYTLP